MVESKPWVKRADVEDAIEILENAERDWNYLNGEERYGTIITALEALPDK